MKILCVIDCLGSGGAQRQMVELAVGFKEMGHDVSFLTYYTIEFYNPVLIEAGIEIHCIEEKNYVVRLIKMRRFIRKGRYDTILSFLEGPNFICEFAGFPHRRWKLVVGERSAKRNYLRFPKFIIYRFFHLFSDTVVANSQANLKMIRRVNPFLHTSECKVIYNVIDFEKWKPLQDYIPRKTGRLTIIVVASHQYLKNLNGLTDALSILTEEELSNLTVHWYGDRLEEPYFDNSFIEGKQKITKLKLDRVISFFPATNQITRKIQEADVVGLFSFYEGFPNVVCEGMACGKPILCTAVSDLPDFLAHDAKLLSEPENPKSISESIRYLIGLSNDKLIEIGRKNEELAKTFFQKEKNVSEYLHLFEK